MQRVYVTGLGVISSIGIGRRAYWEALLAGRSGASEVESFDTAGMGRSIACEVKGFDERDFLTAAEQQRMARCSQLAVASTRMAVEDAGLEPAALAGPRTSVVLGTTMGEAHLLEEQQQRWFLGGTDAIEANLLPRYGTTLLPIHVARALGARGLVQAIPTACAAGNYAIAYAADLIRAERDARP